MEILILVGFITLGLILINIISSIRLQKKLRAELIDSFGKKPKKLDYELKSIESYNFYRNGNSDNSNYIDDITWNDLDMEKVFKRINVCRSSIGEEYLFSVLHQPEFDETSLLKREKLIKYLKSRPEERLKLQMYLSKLGKSNYNGLSSFIFNSKTKKLKYSAYLYKVLAVIPVLCGLIIPFNFSVGLGSTIVAFFLNGFVYYRSKRYIEEELSAIQYFSDMLWCCNKICSIKDSDINDYITDLKREFKIFKSLRGKITGMMQKGGSDFDFIAEYVKIIFLYDLRKYNETVNRISKYSENFHTLYKAVGELDLAICVLSYRESLPFYSVPNFSEDKSLKFEDVYHPLVSEPISNSGLISNDSIVTGSNASGKSTFIKALAVNSILAQTIYTCAAKEYSLRFSLVITSMAVRDNISSGESYFITEIKSLKRIIDKLQTIACTCFIDEILKGTNTIERIAASAAVLKYLHATNCLCLVASHDIELTEILKQQFDNLHFCEQITDSGISFDYKLKQGPSKTRNAIKLLDYMHFDNTIVENAESLVDGFLANRTWGNNKYFGL